MAARISISPICVRGPVSQTSARARPRVTPVPAKIIEACSASGVSSSTGSICFATGRDSPVRADSSTSRELASTRRASAATRSPSPTSRTSPGTTSCAGSSRRDPSRMTSAVCVNACESARIARSALSSCQKPSTPFSTRIAAIAIPSLVSPIATEITAATIRSATNGSSSWRSAIRRYGGRRRRSGAFRPHRSSRRAASSAASPRSGSVPRTRATSAHEAACGRSVTWIGRIARRVPSTSPDGRPVRRRCRAPQGREGPGCRPRRDRWSATR